MKRLPAEHLVPDPPKVRDLEVGEGAWVSRVLTDPKGNVYLQKVQEIFQEEYADHRVFQLRRVRVDRTETGWSVKIPRDHLPMEPKHADLLKPVCYLVDDIEIVD